VPIVDFALITALQEEFEYLQQIIGPFHELTEAANTWYRTRIKADNGTNYEIVLAWQDEMGPLPAHGLTVRVIDRWDPAYIILVGIAGRIEDEVKLGDLIVGQQTFYYDPQAIKDAGIEYRPAGYPGGVALVRQVHAITVSPNEMNAIRQAGARSARTKAEAVKLATEQETRLAREALEAHLPRIHVGTVASGSNVIKSDREKQELKKLHGKLLGVEMEGCGVMHASFFHRENPSQALLIKGISDPANADKAKLDAFVSWRALATENSARLALAIMRRGRLKPQQTDQFKLDTTVASIEVTKERIPDHIRRGFSLLGFPQLVIPKGPLTSLAIQIRAVDANGGTICFAKQVAEYMSGAQRRRSEFAGGASQFATTDVIDPLPIGLYLLAEGKVAKIIFEVRSASSEEPQVGEWMPGI
jgi:nucleoside phosphorylase